MLSTSDTAWEAASPISEITPSPEDAGRDDEGADEEADEDGSGIDEDAAMEDEGALLEDARDEELLLSFREEHAVMERAQEMANKPEINDFI